MAYQEKDKFIHLQNTDKKSTLHEQGDKLGTYHLSDNPKYYEIQRTNNFIFYVEGLSNQIETANNYAKANADDIIRISVSKASVPSFQQSAIGVARGNNTIKFAGKPEFGSGSIELNDYIGAGTKDVLVGWQNKSYDVKTEKVGLVTDYKKDAYLLEYTPDYQLVRAWKMFGCWISSLNLGDYDHEGNGKVSLSATIEYDKAWIDDSDVE